MMDFAVLIDPKVHQKGSKNIDKYLNLARKLGGTMKLSYSFLKHWEWSQKH